MNWWFSSSLTDEQRLQLREHTPIVIMGRGHSGTRVLAWSCQKLGINLGAREHLATADADDQKFTQQIKKVALNSIGVTRPDEVKEKELEIFQKAAHDYYQRLPHPKKHWGWKFPETYLISPYVAATFPQARYIHIVRDGRDIAFKRHLSDDAKRKLGRKILQSQEAASLPQHLRSAISWAFQVDTFDEFRKHVDPSQVFDLTFEEMCMEPKKTIERLCQFLNVEMTIACDDYLQKNINTNKVAQYKKHESSLIEEIEEHINPTLKRYSYL